MKGDIEGWTIGWIDPKDYRCEVCHTGFTLDETVFVVKDGLPYHEYCVEPHVHKNRVLHGAAIIRPVDRKVVRNE